MAFASLQQFSGRVPKSVTLNSCPESADGLSTNDKREHRIAAVALGLCILVHLVTELLFCFTIMIDFVWGRRTSLVEIIQG